MRSTQIIFALATVFLTQSVMAQGQGNGPPPPPGDVNVVNTPDVNVVGGVEITNADPIPVTIENGGATAPTAIEWRFVGYTTTETTGDAGVGALSGYAAMNELCNIETGAQNARMCTSAEIHRSTTPMLSGAEQLRAAWVAPAEPVKVPLVDGRMFAYDRYSISGSISSSFFNSRSMDCSQWNSNLESSGGLAVIATDDPTQKVQTEFCHNTNPIACCAPVAVPVQ